jgi:hypothetical protein
MSYYRPIRIHANVQDLLARTIRNEQSNCLEWQGSRRSFGHGELRVNSRNDSVHRLMATLIYGEPNGRYALHSCDNPPCINPDHLRWGSQKENLLEMQAKGRKFIAYGEQTTSSKLTIADVREIRQLFPSLNKSELARMYGVTQPTIRKVVENITWQNV